jgi:hypothetical protein
MRMSLCLVGSHWCGRKTQSGRLLILNPNGKATQKRQSICLLILNTNGKETRKRQSVRLLIQHVHSSSTVCTWLKASGVGARHLLSNAAVWRRPAVLLQRHIQQKTTAPLHQRCRKSIIALDAAGPFSGAVKPGVASVCRPAHNRKE